jgi:hypothetical protein
VSCQVRLSTLKAGDLYCAPCGAAVPEHRAKPQVAEVRDGIAGERKSPDLKPDHCWLSEGNISPSVGRIRQNSRSSGRTGPGDSSVCQVENDYSTRTC